MTIETITKEEHKILSEIQKKNPFLTLQNKGYEKIKHAAFSEDDKIAYEIIDKILTKSVIGFRQFSNFKLSDAGRIRIRLQYNYGAEDNTTSFTGVGYILLDELLNGFKDE